LLAFAVFRHLREEAGELDEIATDWIAWKYFVHLDIGEVFACHFVFDFKIPCRDVADFVSVRCGIYFELVIFVGEIGVCDVDWYAREPLVQYLIMNATRIYEDTRFRFGVRCGAEYQSRDVTQDHAAKGVGQAHVDAVNGKFELAIFVCS
jgi:hypothetical protein